MVVCNGCHDLLMISPNIDNIAAIVAVNGVDYFCIIYNVNKFDAVNLLENSVLDDRGFI